MGPASQLKSNKTGKAARSRKAIRSRLFFTWERGNLIRSVHNPTRTCLRTVSGKKAGVCLEGCQERQGLRTLPGTPSHSRIDWPHPLLPECSIPARLRRQACACCRDLQKCRYRCATCTNWVTSAVYHGRRACGGHLLPCTWGGAGYYMRVSYYCP